MNVVLFFQPIKDISHFQSQVFLPRVLQFFPAEFQQNPVVITDEKKRQFTFLGNCVNFSLHTSSVIFLIRADSQALVQSPPSCSLELSLVVLSSPPQSPV